jgi:excisionase family DNA binding protein
MSTNLVDAGRERPTARGVYETAAIAGVSASFIRKEIAAKRLKRTQVGRRVLIKDCDLLEWLSRNDPREESEAA